MTDTASMGAFRGSALSGENDIRFSKVPEVTLGFWIIKILATTLGETGGDAVTMSLDLGYAVGTLIEAHQTVAKSNLGAVGGDPLGEDLHKPRLLDGDHEVLWIGHGGQIERHRREHRPRRRLRGIGRPGHDAVEIAMVEQPNRLAGNPIRAALRVRADQRLQHDRPDTGQAELTRQHQPIRARPRDDDQRARRRGDDGGLLGGGREKP